MRPEAGHFAHCCAVILASDFRLESSALIEESLGFRALQARYERMPPSVLTFYWKWLIIHLECLPGKKRNASNCCRVHLTC